MYIVVSYVYGDPQTSCVVSDEDTGDVCVFASKDDAEYYGNSLLCEYKVIKVG